MTLKQIFLHSQRQPNGCLLYAPTRFPKHRYGCASALGYRGGAHKCVWLLLHGPVPDGQCVCHRCDNPRCVEPSHLFLGTMADNMRDRDAKGRNGTLGERSPLARLTADKVRDIRRFTQAGEFYEDVADMFRVSVQTVKRISKQQTWKHLWT